MQGLESLGELHQQLKEKEKDDVLKNIKDEENAKAARKAEKKARKNPTSNLTFSKDRTEERLQSSMSKKILKYLIEKYGNENSFQDYEKNNEETFKEIQKILDSEDNLSSIKPEVINDLYKKILIIAPLTENDNYKVYSKMANSAGCTKEELEDAVKLLSSYREKVHQKFFKEAI